MYKKTRVDRHYKNVYKKVSTIPDIGLGLFAGEQIKKGALIDEFKGNLVSNSSNPTSSWSSIRFEDCVLECNRDNLASYSNDCIIFPAKKRDFKEIIDKDLPLYTCINPPNAEIYINFQLKRAWLKATRNISADEEIFVHYGIPFWIRSELKLPMQDGLKICSIPDYIFRSKSFEAYVKSFYPDVVEIIPTITDGYESVQLQSSDSTVCVVDIRMIIERTNYSFY